MIVDKVDMAVQTNFEEDLQQQEKHHITESCEEVQEDDSKKSLDCDVENNTSFLEKRKLCGIPRAMDNYAACRLATPFTPSPMFDRRTIL